MTKSYESKRLTISYPAVERLCECYGIPLDLPSQTLAGYIERLIFEGLSSRLHVPITAAEKIDHQAEQPIETKRPDFGKLAAMAKKQA